MEPFFEVIIGFVKKWLNESDLETNEQTETILHTQSSVFSNVLENLKLFARIRNESVEKNSNAIPTRLTNARNFKICN